MLPTLAAQGDSVCVSSRYRHGRGVKAGDLVSFRHPCVPGTLAIKRVVGMPGDFVMRDVVDGQGSGREMMLQVCVVGDEGYIAQSEGRLMGDDRCQRGIVGY